MEWKMYLVWGIWNDYELYNHTICNWFTVRFEHFIIIIHLITFEKSQETTKYFKILQNDKGHHKFDNQHFYLFLPFI